MINLDFFKTKPIFGMIHLAGNDKCLTIANEEMLILEQEGVDGCIIENYHGSLDDVKKVLERIKDLNTKMKIGINILPNEYQIALELSDKHKLDFIQLDAVAGKYMGHTFDVEDYMKFKNKFTNIAVLGGVFPKYYIPVAGSDLKTDLEDGMKRAEAIVVTGAGTGKETPLDKIKSFREIIGNHPLIIGAGLNASNVEEQLKIADGAIVGSCFKRHGVTTNPIDRELVKEFMDAVKKVRI